MAEKGYICPVQEHAQSSHFGVRLVSDLFDVGFVTNCISSCRTNHGPACTPGASLKSFRVIDCVTRTVVPAPTDCQFVALSYVWGKSDPKCPKDNARSSMLNVNDLPKVINNSIVVSLKIQFRYLWVDRLCIHQLDPQG
jgi:hypothetical protein